MGPTPTRLSPLPGKTSHPVRILLQYIVVKLRWQGPSALALFLNLLLSHRSAGLAQLGS